MLAREGDKIQVLIFFSWISASYLASSASSLSMGTSFRLCIPVVCMFRNIAAVSSMSVRCALKVHMLGCYSVDGFLDACKVAYLAILLLFFFLTGRDTHSHTPD
jgi:hypothetical protein